jgi:hypothetical protein
MKNDVFSLYPTRRGIERNGSMSPVELAMHESVFIVYRPALRNVTQTCSVKEMSFMQDILSIFVYDNILLILIVSFIIKY